MRTGCEDRFFFLKKRKYDNQVKVSRFSCNEKLVQVMKKNYEHGTTFH